MLYLSEAHGNSAMGLLVIHHRAPRTTRRRLKQSSAGSRWLQ
jgi:hypothetical protein